ncbi:hypothetical protein L1987_32826 [Smallanthus sonchifolius]|uniref:Uncharacterized protein n=1 Tax=Smallanthus sonchifolius TaxID=185202 RepID=A0ACB9HQJ8_9ASTR|nr:hypothetical protein L1987_32826 [Smallanthus sonchifolius]
MLEKPCRILMDLAGPKLRTGKMKPGPCVKKISPKKNAYGNMITTAHVWVAQKGAGPPPPHVSPDAVIYVDGQDFLTYLEIGDAISFSDARERKTKTFVRLRVGDLLVITRDSSNEELTCSMADTPQVTCSSGYLFDSVKPGEPIAFDDGKIWGVIKGTSISEIVVSITHACPSGTKFGPEKYINIPDSKIQYEGLTSKDIIDLDFVGSHAVITY